MTYLIKTNCKHFTEYEITLDLRGMDVNHQILHTYGSFMKTDCLIFH